MKIINFPKEIKAIKAFDIFESFFLIFDGNYERLYQKNLDDNNFLRNVDYKLKSSDEILNIKFLSAKEYITYGLKTGLVKKHIDNSKQLKFKIKNIPSDILAIPEKNILIVSYGEEEYYNHHNGKITGLSLEIFNLKSGKKLHAHRDNDMFDIMGISREIEKIYFFGFEDTGILKICQLEKDYSLKTEYIKKIPIVSIFKIHKVPGEPYIFLYNRYLDSKIYLYNEEKNTFKILIVPHTDTRAVFDGDQCFLIDNQKKVINIISLAEAKEWAE